MAASGGAAQTVEILLVEIDGRTLGLPSSAVVEVVRAVAVTSLPKAPPVVLGVINVRGKVVPVISVRARLGLSVRPIAASDHFVLAVLARAGGREVALHVDQALSLVPIDRARVEPAERVGWGTEHLTGVAVLPDGLVVIVDLEGFLTAAEERALEDELPTAAGERA